MSKVSIALIKKEKSRKKDGTYPLKLRIQHADKNLFINLKIHVQDSQWNGKSVKSDALLNHRLSKYLVEAEKVIHYYENEIDDWSCEYLREIIREKIGSAKKSDVPKYDEAQKRVTMIGGKTLILQDYGAELIKRKMDQGKAGTADSYKQAIVAVEKFGNGKNKISFAEMDAGFLERVKKAMCENGIKDTSRSVYFRALRAMINMGIKEHKLDRSMNYGFDEFKIGVVKPTRKRALELSDIQKILTYDLSKSPALIPIQEYAIIMFNGHGMNFIDLAYLKMSNIKGDFARFHYRRKKTGQEFDIPIVGKSLEIFKKYCKNKTLGSNELVFEIIPGNRLGNVKLEKSIYESRRKVMNSGLKKIAAMCKIEGEVTTYVLRHSYATNLKKQGVDEAFISEFLGHHSVETTRIYLDSFDTKKKDNISKRVAII